MQYHEFIEHVQNRASFSSEDEAVKAIRATLSTLSERLYGNEAQHFLAQLPAEIRNLVNDTSKNEKFSINEFYRKVSERENTDLPKAIHHARAVVDVLKDAVSEGEIKDIKNQLPPEYNPLFGSGSEGKMSS